MLLDIVSVGNILHLLGQVHDYSCLFWASDSSEVLASLSHPTPHLPQQGTVINQIFSAVGYYRPSSITP